MLCAGDAENAKQPEFYVEPSYVITYWSDGKNPTDVIKKTVTVKAGKPIKVNLNPAGGYVAIVKPE